MTLKWHGETLVEFMRLKRMGFDIKKFKEGSRLDGGLRTCLFSLDVKELEQFKFLVKRVVYSPDLVTFQILENERFEAHAMIKELAEKKYTMYLNFFPRTGPADKPLRHFIIQPQKVSFAITMDWEATNQIAHWDVTVMA